MMTTRDWGTLTMIMSIILILLAGYGLYLVPDELWEIIWYWIGIVCGMMFFIIGKRMK